MFIHNIPVYLGKRLPLFKVKRKKLSFEKDLSLLGSKCPFFVLQKLLNCPLSRKISPLRHQTKVYTCVYIFERSIFKEPWVKKNTAYVWQVPSWLAEDVAALLQTISFLRRSLLRAFPVNQKCSKLKAHFVKHNLSSEKTNIVNSGVNLTLGLIWYQESSCLYV